MAAVAVSDLFVAPAEADDQPGDTDHACLLRSDGGAGDADHRPGDTDHACLLRSDRGGGDAGPPQGRVAAPSATVSRAPWFALLLVLSCGMTVANKYVM